MLLAGRGDRPAFGTLVDKYQAPLTNFLHRVELDQTEVQDIAPDVFVRTYPASRRYRPDAKFSTWLYRIAANVALNALKSKRRRPRVHGVASTDTACGEGSGADRGGG